MQIVKDYAMKKLNRKGMVFIMKKNLITIIICMLIFSSFSFAASENHVDRIPHVKDDWEFKDRYAPILTIEEKHENEFGSEDQRIDLILENAEWFENDDPITVRNMVYDGLQMSTPGAKMKITRRSSKRLEVTINRESVSTNEKANFKIPLYSKVKNAGDIMVKIDSDTFISSGTYKYALAIGKGSSEHPTVSIGHIFGKNNPVWLTLQEPIEKNFGSDNKTFILTLNHSKWVDNNECNLEKSIKNSIIKNVSDAKIVSMKKIDDQTVELTINRGKEDEDIPVYFYIPLYVQVTDNGNISLNIKSKENTEFFKDVSLKLEVQEYKQEIVKDKIPYIDEKESNLYQISLQMDSPYLYRSKSGETEKITLDVLPIIENGRTFVPLRGVFESLGVEIKWQPEIQAVLLKNSDTTMQMFVDSNNAYMNNQPFKMPMKPKIINDRVFVPLRFITENFNYHVQWIEEGQKIVIKQK
ncbi:copper amine oxidase N-terminal domain-containing protein [Inediibacterium massiliense]|uniref:copper amine oxidase N-terminal domain-containing protein n=1 Tax=Inediibacterium massiliense TaxID=1658111 RepID=UPI0006B42138|nr:copper amine oxidase N-terminal domain-containing protein [Inediibacterium massiliense]